MQQQEDEITIDLGEILHLLRKKLKIIAIVTLAFVTLAIVYSCFIAKPVYEAKTSILIGKEETSANASLGYNDLMMYQKSVETYGKIATSRRVAENAVKASGSDMDASALMNSITVSPQKDTQIMMIKLKGGNAAEVANLLNVYADTFIKESSELYKSGSAKVLDKAVVPLHPVSPSKTKNVALAFILGILSSVGVIVIKELLNNTVKSEEDIEKCTGLPVLGVIPRYVAKQQ